MILPNLPTTNALLEASALAFETAGVPLIDVRYSMVLHIDGIKRPLVTLIGDLENGGFKEAAQALSRLEPHLPRSAVFPEIRIMPGEIIFSFVASEALDASA